MPLLQLEIWLLILIPARLHLPGMGSIGHPATIVALLLFLLWSVAEIAPTLDAGRRCVPVRLVIAAFWFSILLSYAVMNRHPVPADQLANSDRLIIALIGVTGIALVAAEGLRSMSELMSIVRALVGAIATMCFIALLQSRANVDLTTSIARIPILQTNTGLTSVLSRSGFNRPAGTATHPIEFGVVVGTGLAFALHVAFFDRAWTARWRWITFGLIAIGVPIAISRSALLVAIVVFVMFFAGSSQRIRQQIVPGLALFLCVIFVTVPGLLGTLRGYVFAGNSDSSISTRTDDYAAVAGYLKHSPWVGRGPGTFLPRLRILDNQYLLTLIEAGIVGFIALLAFFTLPAWLGRSGRKAADGEAHRNLGQMFGGAGIGVMLAAATYDSFSFPMFTSVVALVIGLAGAYWRLSREGQVLDG